MSDTNGTVPKAPLATPDQLARFEQLVMNVVTSRTQLINRLFDSRRNISDDCGYIEQPTPEQYQQFYDREPIATRVVQVWPRECWQVQPLVYEDEESDTATAFEEAWDGLGRQLRGDASAYQDEKDSPVWEYLKRGDELSGIGQYGVILIGIDDGLPLSEPAFKTAIPDTPWAGGAEQYFQDYNIPRNGTPKKKSPRLLYIRVFPEMLVQVTQYEANPQNPRFGLPIMYLITFNDPREQTSGIGLTSSSYNVHWTRCIHVADNIQSNEAFGVPRMRPVLNCLQDIQKVRGGSAEMYWRGALPGWSLESNPQMGADVNFDPQQLKDMFEDWSNGLQRFIALLGFQTKSLAPQVVDPTSQLAVQIEAICIQLAIPKRIFMGSERGELASSQDDASWNDRLKERQKNYITPRIVIPFVDRLIQMGVLPKPKGFSVEWPDLTSQSDAEKAAVAVQKTTAITTYVSAGGEQLIPPLEFLVHVLGMSEETAKVILEAAEKANEQQMQDHQAMADQHGFEPAPPPGFKAPEPPPPSNPIKVKEGEQLVNPDGSKVGT